ADAQPIEAVEGVGAELDAGADLAELSRLLQHQRRDALLGERQRRCEAADAAAGDEDSTVLGHPRPSRHAAGLFRAPAGRGYPTGFRPYAGRAQARASVPRVAQ